MGLLTEYLRSTHFPETKYKPGTDIRVPVTYSCTSGCVFCHAEGLNGGKNDELNPVLSGWRDVHGKEKFADRLAQPMSPEDITKSLRILQAVGLNKVHLTGGEPTMHPDLLTYIKAYTQQGVDVAITTNGEIGPDRFESLLNSGVVGINFSIHAVDPRDYLAMDLMARKIAREKGEAMALQYAKRRIRLKTNNMLRASQFAAQNPWLSVSSNTVVSSGQRAVEIVRWCQDLGIKSRLQRDLNDKVRSGNEIMSAIQLLAAEPKQRQIAVGDSSGSGYVFYTPNGDVKVKDFGEVHIELMCGQCFLKGTPLCRERFYGLRVIGDEVQTCIDIHEDGKTVFTVDNFISDIGNPDTVPHNIYQQYQNSRSFDSQ